MKTLIAAAFMIGVFLSGCSEGKSERLPEKPEKLFERAERYEKSGDLQKAITEYTTIIKMEDIPEEQRARALIGRGTVYDKKGDRGNAALDYARIIETKDVPKELRDDAYYRIRLGEGVRKAQILADLGLENAWMGNMQKAIANFTMIIEMEDASEEEKAKAFFHRGFAYGEAGDTQKAIADYTVAIGMDTLLQDRIEALFTRGFTYGQAGDTQKAIADFTTIIEMKNSCMEGEKFCTEKTKVRALYSRALAYRQAGDTQKEIADYTTIIEMKDATIRQLSIPAEMKTWARIDRDRALRHQH